MRFCDALFFRIPRTAEGRIGRANDLVHVYRASIFAWAGTFVASPLVYIEVTVGGRRALSRVPNLRTIRRLDADGIAIERDRG